MACCSNPKIKSSPLCDWCENCGWEYDYVNCTESDSMPGSHPATINHKSSNRHTHRAGGIVSEPEVCARPTGAGANPAAINNYCNRGDSEYLIAIGVSSTLKPLLQP